MGGPHPLLRRLWDFPAAPPSSLPLAGERAAPAGPELRPGFALALGDKGFLSWALRAAVSGLAAGSRVFWVDASNRFDVYGLAQAARVRGADPRAVLRRVALARPFTAFQLEKIVAGLSSLPPDDPVVVSDPMALFYDEDLPVDDARRLFASFLNRLVRMERPALVLARRRRPSADRAEFSRRLFSRAQAAVDWTPDEGLRLIGR